MTERPISQICASHGRRRHALVAAQIGGEAGDQPPGDRRGEQRVAGGDDADGVHELGEWKVEDRS